MELREIRSFIVLAEQLHYGRASQLLNVTQPALTRQIHRLESELGGDLLFRGRHGASLTALGRSFLAKARALLADADELLASSHQLTQGGRLRIGFGFHTLDLVPQAIVRLRKICPQVSLSLKDMSTSEQVDELLSDRIDIGFIRAMKVQSLEMRPILQDRLVLAVSRNALPKKTKAPRLADVKSQPFVLISRDRSPTLHRHALELCANQHFHPRIVQEGSEVTTILALVRAGLGVSLIPESFARNRFPGVDFHRIADPHAAWTVSAAWRRGDPNPLIPRFMKLLPIAVKTPRQGT